MNIGHILASVLAATAAFCIGYGALADAQFIPLGLAGLCASGLVFNDADKTQERRDRVRIRIISPEAS